MPVLVAVVEAGRERLARVLRGRPLEFVASCAEAMARLGKGRYELVIIGAHFDESSGLDLLEQAVALRPGCPIVCVQVAPASVACGPQFFQAFRTACSALGAAEVLDLHAFPDDEAGNERVRRMLERLIHP